MLGAFLALLSAASFAFTNASVRRGVLQGTAGQAMAVSMPVGLLVFFLATWATGFLWAVAAFSAEALFWLCVAGVVHFIWGRYCNARATKAMGANLVGPVQEMNLVVSLVLAILLLGESITPLRAFGIACIFIGPALTYRRRGAEPAGTIAGAGSSDEDGFDPTAEVASTFRPNYVEGYTFAVLSALGFGLSPVMISIAIGGAGAGVSLAAGLVSYGAATLVLAPFLLRSKMASSLRSLAPEPAKWFVISGLSVSISQMFRYMALSVAPVLVVAPILRLSLVFRLLFSRMMNREHEVFGGRMITGTAISLIGALALTVSVEMVIELIWLPEFVVRFARWHWP